MIAQELIDLVSGHVQSGIARFHQDETTDVAFENDRLKAIGSSQSTLLSLRVIVDGRLGGSHATDPDDLPGLVQRALDAARFGSPAGFTYPGPQDPPSVNMHDPAVSASSTPDMIAVCESMRDSLKAYADDILVNARNLKSESYAEFATTAGCVGDAISTRYGVYLTGQRVRGTDILWVHNGASSRSRTIDPQWIACQAMERFRDAEHTATIRTGEMPVLFDPDTLDVLLLPLVLGLSGKNVLMGSSPLAEKIGETIAPPIFDLIDDPLIDFAPGSSRYDADGLARQRNPLVQNGVLHGFLYDLDAASRANKASTASAPGCMPTNLVLRAGGTPYRNILAGIREGLLVRSVMGLGQGNVINGDFSLNVLLGYKIENGSIVGRVKDVMLAGNAYDALRRIEVMSLEQETVQAAGCASLTAPYVLVDGLSIATR